MEKPSISEVHGMNFATSQELASEAGALAKLAALEYGWTVAYRMARRFYAQGCLPTLGEAVAMAETFLAYGTDESPGQRTRRFGAFQRDATEMFRQFVLDRAGHYGRESNVAVEIRGPTMEITRPELKARGRVERVVMPLCHWFHRMQRSVSA